MKFGVPQKGGGVLTPGTPPGSAPVNYDSIKGFLSVVFVRIVYLKEL